MNRSPARSRAPYRAGLVVTALLVMLGAASCGPGSPGGDSEVSRVSRIGDRPLTDEEFASFVRREAGLGPEELDAAGRTRLYEEFLAELLFARAAERDGLAPDADAVSLEAQRLAGLDERAAPETVEQHARQSLLAGMYVEQVLAPQVLVSDEEIERELGPPKKRAYRDHVVFRQILAEEKSVAEQAHRRVTRQGESFEAVAAEVSSAPDRGAVQQRQLSHLPERVVAVLQRTPEGSTSRPVEVNGSWYVFRVLARNRDPDPGRERERKDVQDRLFRARLSELIDQRLGELAEQENIRAPRLDQTEEESR